MRKVKLALAVLVLTAGPANADSDHRGDGRWKWEVGFGFWLGSVSLEKRVDQDVAGIGAGGHVELGVRRRRWLLTGEAGLLSASQTPSAQMPAGEDSPAGTLSRIGVAARYSMKQWNPSRASAPFGGDVWLEFGVGVQHMRRSDEDRQFSRNATGHGYVPTTQHENGAMMRATAWRPTTVWWDSGHPDTQRGPRRIEAPPIVVPGAGNSVGKDA